MRGAGEFDEFVDAERFASPSGIDALRLQQSFDFASVTLQPGGQRIAESLAPLAERRAQQSAQDRYL